MTNDSTTKQIQKYDFHGDTLDVIPDGDRLHVGCALVRMLHDARKRADIAAPRATQLRLVANENGSKKAG